MHNTQQSIATLELNPTFHTAFANAHALLPEKYRNAFAFAKMIFEEILSIVTTFLEVYLRSRFGVRYISVYQLARMQSLLVFSLMFCD